MRARPCARHLLVLAPLVLLVGCGSSSSPAATSVATSAPPADRVATNSGPTTLLLVERPTASTFTPQGGATVHGTPTRPPQAGDVVAFDAQLTRAGAPFGSDHVSFTYRRDGKALVQATLTLPAGTVGVRGTTAVTDSITLPVVSGTGGYAGRGGSLTAKHENQQEDDLTLELH